MTLFFIHFPADKKKRRNLLVLTVILFYFDLAYISLAQSYSPFLLVVVVVVGALNLGFFCRHICLFLLLVNIRWYASKMILCCFEYTQLDVYSHTYLLMIFNLIRMNVPMSRTLLYFDFDSFNEHINAF